MATRAGSLVDGVGGAFYYRGTRYHTRRGGYLAAVQVADSSAPVIANVSPASGSELASAATVIAFDVYDAAPNGLVEAVIVTVKYVGDDRKYVVYDGSEFISPYTASTRTGNGTQSVPFHFALTERGGWHGDIEELFVYAVDAVGNLTGLP